MLSNVHRNNRVSILKNDSCINTINEIKRIGRFIEQLSYLEFGRDYIICKKYSFSLHKILTSTELTIGSIICCCESGCISDANILLRKYRDDLFFYLYLLVYDKEYKDGNNVEKMQSQIVEWIENSLSNLHISQIFKIIGNSSKLNDAILKFNMKNRLSFIGQKLNNYTHSNGYSFYNYYINSYKEDELSTELKSLVDDIKYITISFIFLATLCSPGFIMSNDYIEYLECNEVPPEGSQYLVAPFIVDFIKENIELIGDNCYEYLTSNTCMKV